MFWVLFFWIFCESFLYSGDLESRIKELEVLTLLGKGSRDMQSATTFVIMITAVSVVFLPPASGVEPPLSQEIRKGIAHLPQGRKWGRVNVATRPGSRISLGHRRHRGVRGSKEQGLGLSAPWVVPSRPTTQANRQMSKGWPGLAPKNASQPSVKK